MKISSTALPAPFHVSSFLTKKASMFIRSRSHNPQESKKEDLWFHFEQTADSC